MKIALCVCVFLCAVAVALGAESRYALVIGNGAYGETGILKNPVNDATDIAAALGRLGFSVDLLKDAELPAMENAVIRLSQRLATDPDAIGMFYYAGHGIQLEGVNYLIPVRTSISEAAFLKTKALSAQSVLDLMKKSANRLNLIFLDACRDYPTSWSRGSERGLAVVTNQPPGSVIVYATSAGSTAQDGSGRNGVFTGELLKNIETAGIDLDTVLNRTAQGVLAITGNKQTPAIYKQFFGTVALKTGGTVPGPSFDTVTPGSLQVTLASAGTVSLVGQLVDLPAGGILPVSNVSPGTYAIAVTYADGKSETRSVTVERGMTTQVAFSYMPDSAVSGTMVYVEGGTFNNGKVNMTVSSFCIGATEVTQAEYEAVTGKNPSGFKDEQHPVENVSWYDAIKFCNARSKKEGLTPCYTISGTNVSWNRTANGYRLPTEAEWEYAARGGNKSRGYTYAGSNSLSDVGWYEDNGGGSTQAVGQKKPNELVLYDMSGNVYEWCWDWKGDYPASAKNDYTGPSSGEERVVRGGYWRNSAPLFTIREAEDHNDDTWSDFQVPKAKYPSIRDCSVSDRYSGTPMGSDDSVGFRVVRSPQ